MKKILAILITASLLAMMSLPMTGMAAKISDYSIKQLLAPCVEGDNDSRWGAVAETECEQYIMGFIDAYIVTYLIRSRRARETRGNIPRRRSGRHSLTGRRARASLTAWAR